MDHAAPKGMSWMHLGIVVGMASDPTLVECVEGLDSFWTCREPVVRLRMPMDCAVLLARWMPVGCVMGWELPV